ncbi:M protein, serotype 49 precursor, putative [Perkinsus marinus ATCC 50983]|uniref:M protein, serotype 49, putative n=1 Tax=Perkinsus marinus (strain ATCC 50983 / TXsc) TaxID=423536 RepID=C5K5I6_PERM5|nr:M protein, serotype 49 precursor, putative [Perkinsus marinus ATCC 50983]EER20248.1 M protein, serotype 49 precursor, putative [Perkinsus marinus ATCC 50983]|eukprot:XP_002788452.1 M protein, serotype 49 precursor, putative [Perkinsus marinus ATCC 50983]
MGCAEFVKICLESERLMELNQLAGETPLFLTLMNLRGSTLSHWRWFRLTKTGVMAFQYGDPPEFAEKMFLQQYEGVKDGESLVRAEIQLDFPEDFYQYVSDEVREMLDQIALRVMMVLADRSSDVVSLQEEEKEKYKNEYDKLHRAVAESYASENELLRKAKELNIELTQGMIEVEKLSIGQADDVAAIKEMKSALRELTTEVQTAAEKEAVCMLQALEVSNDLVSVKEDMDDQEAYERSLLQQHVEKLNSVSSEASNKLSKSREGKAAVEAGIKELEQEMAELKEKVKIEKDGLKEAVAEFERIGREPERLAQEIARNLEKLGKIKTAIENEKKEIKKAHVKVEKHEETIKELKEEGRPLKMRIQNIEDTDLDKEMLTAKIRLLEERLNDKKAVLVEKFYLKISNCGEVEPPQFSMPSVMCFADVFWSKKFGFEIVFCLTSIDVD